MWHNKMNYTLKLATKLMVEEFLCSTHGIKPKFRSTQLIVATKKIARVDQEDLTITNNCSCAPTNNISLTIPI